jgi:phage terminase small subunit
MKWSTYVKNVDQVNAEGVPIDKEINTRLSRVFGLAARQRVSLTLERLDDLTENEKDKLFENSIQAYVEYLTELKQKGKKIAMNIISHAWRTNKSKLVKLWSNKMNPFNTYKDLREEDWERFVAKCELEDFAMNSQYMQ